MYEVGRSVKAATRARTMLATTVFPTFLVVRLEGGPLIRAYASIKKQHKATCCAA